MTESEQLAAAEAFIQFQLDNPDYGGDKDDDGIDLNADYVFDLDRLRENLKLTVAERIDRHEARRLAAYRAMKEVKTSGSVQE